MKKIGFIDYFLNEWHANNYPEWIKQNAQKTGRDYAVSYAYGEIPSPNDGMTSKEWCDKNGITLCESIDEICEKSDYLVILSPDNSENHLRYAEAVLKYKKPTYIDKTFAPTKNEAEQIFALSDKYGCPICSTSALRFADELKELKDIESVISIGGGLTYDIYAIHQLEMIVKLIGYDATRVMATQNGALVNLVIEFASGKRATLCQAVYCYDLPFILLTAQKGVAETKRTEIKSQFFINFIDGLITFFDKGIKMADRFETIAVISLIEAGKTALNNRDSWIQVNK